MRRDCGMREAKRKKTFQWKGVVNYVKCTEEIIRRGIEKWLLDVVVWRPLNGGKRSLINFD